MTVDTSGTKGTQDFSVANATSGTTLSVSGAGVATVTGSAKNDTITVAETAGVVHVIDAGAGTDTLNLTAKAGLADVGSITNVEQANISVVAGNDVTLTTSFATSVPNITLTGGNSLSTFTTGTLVTEVKTFDASAFKGNIVADVAANAVDSTVVLKAGALATDELNYTIGASGTDALYSTGIEILDLDINETSTLDLGNATGVTTIDLDLASNKTLTVDKMVSETIKITTAASGSTAEAKLADASGSTDSVSFLIDDVNTSGSSQVASGIKLKTTDIETVNLKNIDVAQSLDLSTLSMTAAGAVMSLNVTGDKALTVSALNADVTTIDASGMDIGGSFVQTGRSNTGIQTATGSGGDDTFIMANKADALAAGAGADTLDINDAVILGGVAVDLAAADQVVSYNGSANAAVQSGFQNVDLSGYTGDFGSEVNGDAKANTITGTAKADEITGGLGGDTITGGAGADVIDLSVDSGADNVRYVASTGGIDTVTNFDTTEDTLTLTAISGIGASTKASHLLQTPPSPLVLTVLSTSLLTVPTALIFRR